MLETEANRSLNSRRPFHSRPACYFARQGDRAETITEQEIRALVQICGASEFFGEMIASSRLSFMP